MDNEGFYIWQVDKAEQAIRDARADAVFDRSDYGFGLAVWGKSATVFIVFQPGRADIGQPEVVSDDAAIDSIIARLRG